MYLLMFHHNSKLFERSPNSLTQSYFTEELKTGGVLIHRWIRTGGILNHRYIGMKSISLRWGVRPRCLTSYKPPLNFALKMIKFRLNYPKDVKMSLHSLKLIRVITRNILRYSGLQRTGFFLDFIKKNSILLDTILDLFVKWQSRQIWECITRNAD